MPKMYIELNRNLHGWGDRNDVLEVDEDNQAANDLVEQELATRVAKKDLRATLLPAAASDAEPGAPEPEIPPVKAAEADLIGQARSAALEAEADAAEVEAAHEADPADGEPESDDGLEKLKVPELMELAIEEKVDLTGANRKPEMLERIRADRAAKA